MLAFNTRVVRPCEFILSVTCPCVSLRRTVATVLYSDVLYKPGKSCSLWKAVENLDIFWSVHQSIGC